MFAQKIVSTPVENHRNSTNFFHSVHSPDAAQTPDSDIIGDGGAAFRKVDLPCPADDGISFSNGSFCPADEGKPFSKGALCPADEGKPFSKGALCPADERISFPKGDLYPADEETRRINELPYTADERISSQKGNLYPADEETRRINALPYTADERISSQKGNLYPAHSEETAVNNARYPIRNGNELPSGDSFERDGAHSVYRDSPLRSVVGIQCSAASGGVSAGGGVEKNSGSSRSIFDPDAQSLINGVSIQRSAAGGGSLSGAGGGVGSGRGVQLPRSRDEPFPDGFRPPSVAEVRDFCAQSGIRVDARHFCDYYASKNWMTGDTRIKNWRNVVKSWATNGY